jgi:colicin import membrane protein
MSVDPSSGPAQIEKKKWTPTISFWITAGILLLVTAMFAATDGLIAVLALFGLIAAVTGLFALVFKRRSWAGLRDRKDAKSMALGGTMLLIVGLAAAGCSAIAADGGGPVPASATPSPSMSSIALSGCGSDGMSRNQGGEVFFCDEDDNGVLVWVDRDTHEKAVAAAAAEKKAQEEAAKKAAAEKKAKAEAAEKAAEEKKAKDAAAKKAAAEKKAQEEAAAQQAEADRLAQEEAQRQAREAQRLAEEQAAEEAEQFVPAPAPAVGFANCSEAKAAGAAPVYSGQPGYSSKLDRDGDGVGCES